MRWRPCGRPQSLRGAKSPDDHRSTLDDRRHDPGHATATHARINDGTYRFGLQTYYIRPAAQVSQLHAAGFTDVEVLAQRTGEDLTTNPDQQDAAP